jgi:inactivated superfamily I helicase
MALDWQQLLEGNPQMNMAKLAETHGCSRARVTQIMNLLKLPEDIRKTLLALREPEQIRSLTERRLRPIVACHDTESQNRQVQELVATLGH